MIPWLVERNLVNTVMQEHKPFRIEKMQLEITPTKTTELGQPLYSGKLFTI
jgi:hypothetical protein